MTIEEKIKDLIEQAAKERSHYYVRSVCEEALYEIELLKTKLRIAEEEAWHYRLEAHHAGS